MEHYMPSASLGSTSPSGHGALKGLPRFSPVLIAGFLARPLPLAPLNLLLGRAMQQMHRQHKGVFDRMTAVTDPSFLIVPNDLPFALVMRVDAAKPSLKAVRRTAADALAAQHSVAATITGPFEALLALLEGKIDGDALFFTRALSFSGDTEAVLALRNAVDGAEIDLARDAAHLLGPFARLLAPLGGLFNTLWRRSSADMAAVAASLTGGQETRLRTQEEALEALERQVRTLSKRSNRRQKQTQDT
jgi:O2-independent ubiquinone biosynthesis accessory factor UbiT